MEGRVQPAKSGNVPRQVLIAVLLIHADRKIAITYDDVLEMKRLYINGELVVESNDTLTPNDTTPFNIGAGQDNGDG